MGLVFKNGATMKKKQVALFVLIGFIGLAMLAGIVSVLVPSRYMDYRVMQTVMVVGSYAIGGLIIVGISGRMRWTFRLCAISLIVSMIIFVGITWLERVIDWEWQYRLSEIAGALLFISITLAHRLLVYPLSIPSFFGRLTKRTALISASCLCAVGVVWVVNDGFWEWEELVGRLIMVFAIVAAGSTFAVGALAIFGPKPGDDEPGLLSGSMPVSITCPRCQSAVEAQSNKESRCGSCRLKIRVEVEEPRCPCGYLLYELESDTCPECGKRIAPEDRWRGNPSTA
jgi:hypothetical protein